MWSKIILNPKKDNLENGFLKPEYPFKDFPLSKLYISKHSNCQCGLFNSPAMALEKFECASFKQSGDYDGFLQYGLIRSYLPQAND